MNKYSWLKFKPNNSTLNKKQEKKRRKEGEEERNVALIYILLKY